MPCGNNISEIRAYRLGAERIDQAYPLVRELKENLTLDAWREYASSFFGPSPVAEGHRGIIVAEYRNCLRGLLSYDISNGLVDQKTLAVRDVIVLGLPAGQPAARSLLQQLFAIADAHRCDAIRVNLSAGMEWLVREWSDPQGQLFRFPVICFLPGSHEPAPPSAAWRTPPVAPPASLP